MAFILNSPEFTGVPKAPTAATSDNSTQLATTAFVKNQSYLTTIGVTTANGVSGSSSGGTTPSLTITLGAITPTSVNGLTLAAASAGFTIAGGSTSKTLTVSNTLTLAGTDGSTLNIGSGGTLGTAAFTASSAYEPALGNPSVSGYVLTSTTGGVRSWTLLTSGFADPMTTKGDIIYSSDNTPTPTRLAIGTTGYVLTVASGLPSWSNTPSLVGTNFSAIPNSALSNSSVTIGTTSISLGNSSTTLAGLTGITTTGTLSAATITASALVTANLGLTVTGAKTTLAACAAGYASLKIGNGTVPSSPTAGDIWAVSGILYYHNGTSSIPINPMTTLGDIIYGATNGVPTRLAGSAGVLTSTGAAAPTWNSAPSLTGTNFTSIPNSALTNSSVTIGSTSVALGATVATFAGMTLTSPTITGGTLSSGTLTVSSGAVISITAAGGLIVPTPSSGTDAANKAYVDAVAQGLSQKPTARLATTTYLNTTQAYTYNNGTSGVGATLTNAGTQAALTVDGTAAAVGDILLVKNEVTYPQYNGLWVVTTVGSASTNWVLTRHVAMDSASEFLGGLVPVANAGASNDNTLWLQENTIATVGTTAVSFTQLNGATALVQGSGINISGNTISIASDISVSTISASGQITSTVATGTAPFVVASTTAVANLSIGGNAGSATYASAITITNDAATATSVYPIWTTANTGNLAVKTTSGALSFVPSTGVLSATGFSGSGAALTSLTAGNLSGTIPSAVLGNSTVYIGTTAVALNRSSASLALTGITSIDGSAASATYAGTVTIANDTSTSTSLYPTFTTANTGNLAIKVCSTKLSFIPSTGILTATGFSGSGASLTSLTAANLSGTIPSTVLANSTVYIGTTAVALNRASASLALTGITSIDGSAASISGNLTGDVTSVGMATTLSAATVVGKALTGYTAGTDASDLAATDSILTAFKKLQYQNTLGLLEYSTKTAAYTTVATDRMILADASSAAFVITLIAAPTAGMNLTIKKIDSTANAVTINGNGITIDGASTVTITAQWNALNLFYNGTAWYIY